MTAAAGSAYPADFVLDPPEKVANWRPLVHWLLAVPHFVILYVLGAVAEVLTVVSWFAIVFTGKDIEGLQGLRMMYLRYTQRAYVYMGFMVEEYPPCAFQTTAADPGDYPRVRVDFAPQLEDRNRVTTFFRLVMVIPHLVVLVVLAIGAIVCGLIGFFAVLFTGRWPDGLRAFVAKVIRYSVRMMAYFMLLTDEYPPFTLD